jgi:hypothetical protein
MESTVDSRQSTVWAIALVVMGGVMGAAEGTDRLVPAGKWGGRGARLELTAKGGTIELDCANGTFDAPLVLDAAGAFDVKGTLVRERPGPIFEGVSPKGEAVRYKGRLEGDTLSLKIVTDDEKARELGSVKATRGGQARLTKCL